MGTNQICSSCLTWQREEVVGGHEVRPLNLAVPGGHGVRHLNMDRSGLAERQPTGCLSRCCNSLVCWNHLECLGLLENRCWPTLVSAPLGSECPSRCPLILERSRGRSLGTGEAGCWSLRAKTKTEIVWGWLKEGGVPFHQVCLWLSLPHHHLLEEGWTLLGEWRKLCLAFPKQEPHGPDLGGDF